MANGGVLSSLTGIMAMLPQVLYLTQLFFYVFLLWITGSLAAKGLKGHRPFSVKFPVSLMMGAICLISGLAFSGFVPFLSSGFPHMLHLDVIVTGMLSAIIVGISLRLMTHDASSENSVHLAHSLKRKITVLEEMLSKKAGHISEKEAKRIATEAMHGYTPTMAKVIGSEYHVDMIKNDKQGKVILDAWDGEIKDKIKQGSAISKILKDPKKMTGVILIVALIASSLYFFEGFPDPNESFSSLFGMSPDDIGNMAGSLDSSQLFPEDLPGECPSPMIFSQYANQMQDPEYLMEHVYENDEIKRQVEAESGDSVRLMIRINEDTEDMIFAFTDRGKGCYLTNGVFCSCIDSGMVV